MRSFILIAAVLGATIAPTPSQSVTTFRIHVAVEDQAGKPVDRLPAEVFSVTVDGASRPIESVVAADQPLSVTLLVDESLSMRPFAGRLQNAAKAFAAGLDAADRWRVGRFGDRIRESQGFAPGRSPFRLETTDSVASRERTVRGGSPLWDAIDHSVDLLADQSGRRTVLVFTDGRASGNRYGLEEVANQAVDRAVSVHAVVPDAPRSIRQDGKTIVMVTPAANLDRLAQYTGGVLLGGYEVRDQPLKQLRDLAARLRAGYTVTFALAESDSRRHRLDVRVSTPGLRVRAPMAFRAPGPAR